MTHQVKHSRTERSAHNVFMCFVFIWAKTATCATYILKTDWFLWRRWSVYCAVRTGSLNKAVCATSFKGLMHLLYISRHVTFSYVSRRTSAPSSGRLISNCSIFGATAGSKRLSKHVGKIRSFHWCTIFRISRRLLVINNSYNPLSHNTSLWCGWF